MAGRDQQAFVNESEPKLREPRAVEWHDACKIPGMTSGLMVYRATAEVDEDESYVEQTRRRAARWHAWLKSPHCTFPERENFERWCADPANAAAYVAFCGDLAALPEIALEPQDGSELEYGAPAFAVPRDSARLEADTR